jgi:hypothetical protein
MSAGPHSSNKVEEETNGSPREWIESRLPVPGSVNAKIQRLMAQWAATRSMIQKRLRRQSTPPTGEKEGVWKYFRPARTGMHLSPTSPPHLSKQILGRGAGLLPQAAKFTGRAARKMIFFTLPCQCSFFPSKPPPPFTQQSKTTTPRDQPRDLIVLGIY